MRSPEFICMLKLRRPLLFCARQATSSLDTGTEAQIMGSLSQLAQVRIVVFWSVTQLFAYCTLLQHFLGCRVHESPDSFRARREYS